MPQSTNATKCHWAVASGTATMSIAVLLTAPADTEVGADTMVGVGDGETGSKRHTLIQHLERQNCQLLMLLL